MPPENPLPSAETLDDEAFERLRAQSQVEQMRAYARLSSW